MTHRQQLRLMRLDRRIIRQLPKGQSYYPKFYWYVTDPDIAVCHLNVGSEAVVTETEVRQNLRQAALLHLVKAKRIEALYAMQGYVEHQIRDLEKVT